jgi:hypothetical protein
MKNIFNKTNAPYLASGALAIGILLASGIFAVAPYIGFLAPVAALSLGLPFVIGGVVFSAAAIALSAVVINKNNTISERKAQIEAKGKENTELTLKLKGKEAEVEAQKQEIAKQVDEISNLKKQLDENEPFYDAVDVQKETETPSPENQPIEGKASGYLDQAVNTANWLVHQAAKAMPYLAATYLPYVYYNYITTPVSVSVGDVNVTQPFDVHGITSPVL